MLITRKDRHKMVARLLHEGRNYIHSWTLEIRECQKQRAFSKRNSSFSKGVIIMNKRILLPLLLIIVLLALTACGNRDIFDTVYTFDQAIIKLPNGEIVEGKVESWRDFADGDQLQITIDGKTYLVHSTET